MLLTFGFEGLPVAGGISAAERGDGRGVLAFGCGGKIAPADVCPTNPPRGCVSAAERADGAEACKVVRDDGIPLRRIWNVRPAAAGANIEVAGVETSLAPKGGFRGLPRFRELMISVNHRGGGSDATCDSEAMRDVTSFVCS